MLSCQSDGCRLNICYCSLYIAFNLKSDRNFDGMPKLQFPGKALSKRFNDLNFESAQFSTDNLGLRETCEDTVPQQQHDGSQRTQLQRASLISRCTSGSPWIGVEFFLCVSVKEAFDLAPAVPMYPATCDRCDKNVVYYTVESSFRHVESQTRELQFHWVPEAPPTLSNSYRSTIPNLT